MNLLSLESVKEVSGGIGYYVEYNADTGSVGFGITVRF